MLVVVHVVATVADRTLAMAATVEAVRMAVVVMRAVVANAPDWRMTT